MSSHHVVRDHQEAIILLLHPLVDKETLGELLEWGSALWVEEETLPWLDAHRIKPDGILAKVSDIHVEGYFPDVTVLQSESDLLTRIQLITSITGNSRFMVVSSDCVPPIRELIAGNFFSTEIFFVDDSFRYFFSRGEKIMQLQNNGRQTELSPMDQSFSWVPLDEVFSAVNTDVYLVRILWQ